MHTELNNHCAKNQAHKFMDIFSSSKLLLVEVTGSAGLWIRWKQILLAETIFAKKPVDRPAGERKNWDDSFYQRSSQWRDTQAGFQSQLKTSHRQIYLPQNMPYAKILSVKHHAVKKLNVFFVPSVLFPQNGACVGPPFLPGLSLFLFFSFLFHILFYLYFVLHPGPKRWEKKKTRGENRNKKGAKTISIIFWYFITSWVAVDWLTWTC